MRHCPRAGLTGIVGTILFSLACPILGQPLRQLPGQVPAVVRTLTPIGRLVPTNYLHLAIGVPLRNEDLLQQLLVQLYDPRSTNYHRFLSADQFTARFGPLPADYEAVAQFAQANGLRVVGRHPNRLVLDVAGTVPNIERAFGITLQSYHDPAEGRRFFAPDSDPVIRADLPVADVWGLTDYYQPRPLAHRADAATMNPLNYNGTGPGGAYRGSDFRHAYAPGAPQSGVSQVAAVAEFDGYYANDIATYAADCGYTNVPLQNVLLNGVSGNPGYSGNANAVAEVSLDIEMQIAMAPGLAKIMVYEGSNPYDVFNRIATDNTAKQISCSWSWSTGPSHNWGHPGTRTLDSVLKQIAAQGQSFFQASGDNDAYTGNQAFSSTAGPIPVDSIYVTSVGGTSLSMSGGGTAWASETTWNWGGNTGSGGGISSNYLIPYWQTNVNMLLNSGSTTYRNVPDVALTADAVFVVYNNGSTGTFGGTSCAAPLWAGFTALINEQVMGAGQPAVGFLNPALYNIAAGPDYGACFHDVTTGNNIGSNFPGLYQAVSGYDLCTGLGTPNGTNLINALAPFPVIVSQPASQKAIGGSNVVFRVLAGGASPLAYQWQMNRTNLVNAGNVSGATSSALTIAAVSSANVGNYDVVVTNAYGSVTSSIASLTIIFPPTFTSQPTNQTVLSGGNALFAATVTGATPLSYQWRQNGTNLANSGAINGATSNVLTVASVNAGNAGGYTLLVTNVDGAATSTVATLTVLLPPVITTPPAAQTIQCGSNVAFTVTAAGTAPLHYQWSLDGSDLAGATKTSLLLTNVHLPDHIVAVLVTNLYGGATSSVPLTVQDTVPPVITLSGANPYYVELDSAYVEPGAAAYDVCAGAVAVAINGAVITNAVGTNTLTYTAGDGAGNIATAVRTVVVRDTVPPTITWSFTNLTIATDTNCTALMPEVTGTNYLLATDLSEPLTVTQAPAAGMALGVGTNQVLLTVADAYGNTAYSTNTLVVQDQTPPVIQVGPQSQTNVVSANVSFGVVASACTPLSFQWYFNSALLDFETNATLTLSNITTSAAGDYFVVVNVSGGSCTSAVATLTVNLLASSLVLVSSTNPAGYMDDLRFTATVMPTNASGTVQFLTNDVLFDTEPMIGGLAVSTNLASLPRGTNFITALYSGDPSYLPSTNILAQVVTNHPPTAAPVFYSRLVGASLEIPLSDLQASWSDLDGDTVSLAAVVVSTNGVTLMNDSTNLFYSNPNGVADQFTCTLLDGWGGTNYQNVYVSIIPSTPIIVGANNPGGFNLTLSGAPGGTYVLESADALNFPVSWTALATNTLGTNGVWQFLDTDSTNFPQRFYRLRLAP